MIFSTPEEVEDAYYDALESGDLEGLLGVWDDSEDIACSLPMTPLAIGRDAVASVWRGLFDALKRVDLQTKHLRWIHADTLAIHLLEELATGAPGQTAPPVYATNVYRRRADGWRMILHHNAPLPPPPGSAPEGFPHLP